MKRRVIASLWTVLCCSLGYGSQQSLADTVTDQKQTPASASTAASSANAFEVTPGLMQSDRDNIAMIEAAKSKGVGVGAYQAFFKQIEDKVRAGASQTDVEPLITRLSDSLHRQLSQLQTQPSPTVHTPKAPLASSAKPATLTHIYHKARASSLASKPSTGEILTVSTFNQIKNLILAHGDHQDRPNNFERFPGPNPHIALPGMDLYVSPRDSDPRADFTELTICTYPPQKIPVREYIVSNDTKELLFYISDNRQTCTLQLLSGEDRHNFQEVVKLALAELARKQ